jgi:putative transposon-encoded protein
MPKTVIEENIKEMIERIPTKVGGSCHVILPKEYENKRVIILLLEDD